MRCVIISGSPDTDISFIKQIVKSNDYVICADQGYHFAKEANIKPDLIIGDFDSCPDKIPNDGEIIRLVPEKDDSDTAHCVEVALSRGFDDIILLGAVGGRTDHTLANLSILLYIANKGAKGILLSENEKIILLQKGKHSFSNLNGKTFSLFPFGCKKVCVSYSGVKYMLNHQFIFSETSSLGLSNIFTSDESEINILDGDALLIINSKI